MNYRKLHRILSLVIAIPTGLIFVTGLLLLLRHHVEYIQPKKEHTGHQSIDLSFNDVMTKLNKSSLPLSQEQIAKVVLRPDQGLIEVLSKDNDLIQLDGKSGEILKRQKKERA